MELQLKNFGCHINKNVSFIKGLNLLCGNSGAGKTTILDSIKWALHGGKLTAKKDSSNDVTTVILKYENMLIERGRGNNKLIFSIDDKKYKNNEAQELIYKYLEIPRDSDIWLISSYLQQSMRSKFLELKENEKINILNSILFSDNPEEMISKLDIKIREQYELVQKLTTQYNTRLSDLNTEFSNVSNDNIMNEEDMMKYNEEMKELGNRIKINNDNRQKYDMYMKRLNELRNRKFNITEIKKKIDELHNKISKTQYYNKHINKVNNLNNMLNKLNIDKPKYELDKLLELKDYNEKRLKYESCCEVYSSEWINSTKTELKNLIDFFNKYEYELKQREELEKKLNECINILNEQKNRLNRINIEKLQEEYDSLHIIKIDFMELHNLNDKLTKSKKYDEITKILNDHKRKLNNLKIDSCDYTKEQLNEFKNINNKIQRYKKICDVYSSEWIEKKKKELFDQLAFLTTHQNEIKNIPKLEKSVKQYEDEINVAKASLSHIKDIKLEEVDVEYLKELEEEVANLKLLTNVLKCPYCNNNIIYDGIDVKAIEYDAVPIELYKSKNDELIELTQKYKKYLIDYDKKKEQDKRKNELIERIKMLEEKYNECNEKLTKYVKYKKLNKDLIQYKYNELNKVEYIEIPPITNEMCDKLLNFITIRDEIDNIVVPEYIGNTKEIEAELNYKNKLYNEELEKATRKNELKLEIDKQKIEKQYIMENIQKYENEIEHINAQLNNCKKYNGNITREEAIEKYEILKNVEYLEPAEISLDECNKYIKYYEIIKELDEIGKLEFCGNEGDLQEKINEQHEKIASTNLALKEEQEIKSTLRKLKIDEDFELLIQKYEAMCKRWPKIVEASKYVAKKKVLDNDKEKLDYENSKLNNMNLLREIEIKTMYKYLEETIEILNYNIREILNAIFDDTIDFNINFFKNDKKRINITINYKGNTFTNVNSLSGGEKDRLSFAILVAFNKIVNSKLLILDESFSSLNFDVREKCIKLLRSLEDRIIICVNHEDIQGNYDNIVNI